jgi:hypothetical protein
MLGIRPDPGSDARDEKNTCFLTGSGRFIKIMQMSLNGIASLSAATPRGRRRRRLVVGGVGVSWAASPHCAIELASRFAKSKPNCIDTVHTQKLTRRPASHSQNTSSTYLSASVSTGAAADAGDRHRQWTNGHAGHRTRSQFTTQNKNFVFNSHHSLHFIT